MTSKREEWDTLRYCNLYDCRCSIDSIVENVLEIWLYFKTMQDLNIKYHVKSCIYFFLSLIKVSVGFWQNKASSRYIYIVVQCGPISMNVLKTFTQLWVVVIRLLQKSYQKEKNILNTIQATMTRQWHGLYTLNIIILNIRKIYLHKRRFVEKEKKV